MKKFILPLLLLLAIGMLAAVESDPSAVVGYVKYDTSPGRNIIALPMAHSWAMAGDFANSFGAGVVTSVSRYNNVTKAFQTTNKVGPTWIGNFAIAAGDNLMFTGAAALGASFYSIGALPANASTIAWSLTTGRNTLMLPLNKSNLNTVTLLGGSVGTINSVSRYNNLTKAYQTSNKVGPSWIGSYAISIGDPLMVTATANTVWPSRGEANQDNLTISK